MNKCKNCSKVIESKGTKPKQFCSDACRKKWNRTQLQEQASKRTLQADELANGHEQTDTVRVYSNSVKPLPSDIPKPISSRYARGEPEYNAMIDMLINTSLAQLKADGVWIPVWRLHRAGCAGLSQTGGR